MTINNFSIFGLYGILNFNIKLIENRLVLVAENGAGKTTILRLFYLFFSKQWSKLSEYDFDKIVATIDNREFTFKKNDFEPIYIPIEIINQTVSDFPLYEDFIKYRIAKYAVRDLISNDLLISELEGTYDVPIALIYNLLDRLRNFEFQEQKFDWDINVLYLPTYRRIEREFNVLYEDVDKRLLQFIKQAIPSINIQIDNEKNLSEERYSETENDLSRIFETLWQARDFERWGGKSGNHAMELIEFGMDDVQFRLSLAVSNSSGQNPMIAKYVNICNKYLSENKQLKLTKSGKYFEINSLDSSEPLLLSLLSSGEKQILSLFSYLLTSPQKLLVIIDEPELSLSISWQEMILTDLLEFGINGLIVATHSPFIVSQSIKPITFGLNEFSIRQ